MSTTLLRRKAKELLKNKKGRSEQFREPPVYLALDLHAADATERDSDAPSERRQTGQLCIFLPAKQIQPPLDNLPSFIAERLDAHDIYRDLREFSVCLFEPSLS